MEVICSRSYLHKLKRMNVHSDSKFLSHNPPCYHNYLRIRHSLLSCGNQKRVWHPLKCLSLPSLTSGNHIHYKHYPIQKEIFGLTIQCQSFKGTRQALISRLNVKNCRPITFLNTCCIFFSSACSHHVVQLIGHYMDASSKSHQKWALHYVGSR